MTKLAWLQRPIAARLMIIAAGTLAALGAAAVLTTPRYAQLPNGNRCIVNAGLGTRISSNHQHVTVFAGSVVTLEPPMGAIPGWGPIVQNSDPAVVHEAIPCGDVQAPAGRWAVPFETGHAGQATLTTSYLTSPFAFGPEMEGLVQDFDGTVTIVPDPRPFVVAVVVLALAGFGYLKYRRRGSTGG